MADKKIKTIKFSELENWSGEKKSKSGIDLLEFETTVGAKLKKIANSYNLDLLEFEKGDYLRDEWQLPFEVKQEQYRVTLGKIWTLEDVKEEWRATDIKGFEKEWGTDRPGYKTDFLNDLEKIGTIERADRNELTFSVFLPEIKKNHHLLSLAVWQSAALYLFILRNSTDEVYDGKMLEYFSAIHNENLGKYFEISKFQVSNKNVNRVADYAYRLYKDSKFFYELRDFLGDSDYDNLLNDLNKLK